MILICMVRLRDLLTETPRFKRTGNYWVITKFYSDTTVGTEGEEVGKWETPSGQQWVRLYFGKNAGGQKMIKSYPIEVLKKK